MRLSDQKRLKRILDAAYYTYATDAFIPDDPIQVLFDYEAERDQEIAGIMAATFAWGKRSIILNKLGELFSRMDHAPFEFVMEPGHKKFKALQGFKHRTFLPEDVCGFMMGLRSIYVEHGGLKQVFCAPPHFEADWIVGCSPEVWHPWSGIQHFRNLMLSTADFLPRTSKHISNPGAKASCKRLHMFLRWMVRHDAVDPGIWSDRLTPQALRCPLDVHSGRVARALGLLQRKADDALAVEELTANLRLLHPEDPVSYDLALFGLGVSGAFSE
jgi:uncharacterized protein (TIGR02757 family)